MQMVDKINFPDAFPMIRICGDRGGRENAIRLTRYDKVQPARRNFDGNSFLFLGSRLFSNFTA